SVAGQARRGEGVKAVHAEAALGVVHGLSGQPRNHESGEVIAESPMGRHGAAEHGPPAHHHGRVPGHRGVPEGIQIRRVMLAVGVRGHGPAQPLLPGPDQPRHQGGTLAEIGLMSQAGYPCRPGASGGAVAGAVIDHGHPGRLDPPQQSAQGVPQETLRIVSWNDDAGDFAEIHAPVPDGGKAALALAVNIDAARSRPAAVAVASALRRRPLIVNKIRRIAAARPGIYAAVRGLPAFPGPVRLRSAAIPLYPVPRFHFRSSLYTCALRPLPRIRTMRVSARNPASLAASENPSAAERPLSASNAAPPGARCLERKARIGAWFSRA